MLNRTNLIIISISFLNLYLFLTLFFGIIFMARGVVPPLIVALITLPYVPEPITC